MLNLDQFISHRFYGFGQIENSLDGLQSALDFGILHLECDIRITACGTAVVFHDEYAQSADKALHRLADIPFSHFSSLGGDFKNISCCEAFFETLTSHSNQNARLWLDIKDAGFEADLHAQVCAHTLDERITYISWLPEVLYALRLMAPHIPLYFSHWPKPPAHATARLHKVFQATNHQIPPPNNPQRIQGNRIGWHVPSPLQGEFLDLLQVSQGGIFVPQSMLDATFVKAYRDCHIHIGTFAYMETETLLADDQKYKLDYYMIDDKAIFEYITNR